MPDVDPEKLLKELDAELVRMRARRKTPASGGKHTARILLLAVFGVMLVVVLWVLQMFLSQMIPARPQRAPSVQSDGHK